MNKKLLLSLVPLLLIGVFLGLPTVVRPAYAAGTVCFNDPSSFSVTAPCAPANTALNAPAPNALENNARPAGSVEGPRQIRIGVFLSGPDLINGFDITVITNRTVLRPTAIDLTGTILAAPISNTVLCIDGALVSGPTCLATDVSGTIHLAESGASGQLSTASTGLLFTLVYNVTSRTPTRGQLVTFQTGCGSPTSPTSDPPICITITNGGAGPVPETFQTIKFNNSVDPNWVAISTPSPTTYTFNFGTPSPVVKFNATAEASFPGLVGSNTVTFTTIASPGLTVSFTGAVTSCGAGAPAPVTCGVSASFSAPVGGTYFATILGNYVSPNDTTLSPGGTLAGTVTVSINIVDIAWTVNGLSEYNPTTAQTLYMSPARPMRLPFTVTSLGGFAGTVTYTTAALTGTTGLVFVYPATFSLAAGQTRTFLINGTATAQGPASYVTRITLTGSISTFHNSALLSVKVSAFTFLSNVTSLNLNAGSPGQTGGVKITSTSLGNPASTNGFAGTLTLSSSFTGPAGGTLNIVFKNPTITLTPGSTSNANLTITAGSIGGAYTVNVTAIGGTNNGMSNSTLITVNVATPITATTLVTTVSSTSVVVGTTAFDSATLSGANAATATGTVTYMVWLNGVCSTGGKVVSTVTVTGGVVPNSRAVLFNATGTYSFNATYSGDGTRNLGSTAACEPLTVIKATPGITTAISPSSSIIVGASVTDQATLTGGFPSTGVTGSVTYAFFSNGSCTGTPTSTSVVTVGAGNSVPASSSVTPGSAGSFAFNATYGGDANNNRVSSACEPLTVNKTTPTITTAISPSPTITVGSSVTDQATLTGGFPSTGVTGTVTYNFFSLGTCTGTPTSSSTVTVGAGNAVPASSSVTPASVGSFSFNATYNGDGNNNRVSSACEPLTVNKATPTITTVISPSSTITVGSSVTDQATLTGGFPSTGVTGSVTYAFFSNGTCTGTPTSTSVVTVGAGNSVPASSSVTPPSAGSFAFNATYGGNGNNNRVSSTCEPLTVNKASPTIATTLSATTITVGSSVTDSSTMASFFQAGGTVTYNLFSGGTCAGTATVVSTVTVTNGVVPNSAASTPTPAGAYSFDAVYSGDANNNGATSACEPLTVNKASPTITTTLSATTITVGTSVTDSSTMASFFQAGGTVTYNEFSGATCAGTATVVSTVTVTNGVVPNSAAVTPTPAGAFSFDAVYSGDVNNNGATSACEPLTVNKTSPTITTTLSATTITVGTSVTDSSTLASSFQAGGTVTYNEFSGGTCAGTATVVSTVTVTNGVVPNSAAVTPTPAGAFSFDAVYSGDANNNGATSACEPLTVNKASPTIATTLSSTTPVVGTTVTDSSTLSSFFQAGGTVTYSDFANAACTAPGTTVSTVTVTNGVVPNSRAVLFNATGSFSFIASYSGDANNNGATSACEPLTVQKASPTITTTLSATTITVGTSVTDSSTLASFFQAGGTATYNEFSGATCAGTATVVSTVTVTNGVVPNSAAVTPTPAGSFSFDAVYSGDVNNNGATSACEPLTVNKASPTITTTLSATTITVGTSVTDSSTLTGFFQAGGTATYNEFSGSTCAGTATVVSTVTVTNGVVPNSASVTPTPAGSFSFDAVYSGDANNNGATSACEPLTVNKTSPTISTTLSATTVTVGTSVTDSSTLTSSFQAGGSVTYNEFGGATCAGTATVVSTVTVTNGVVPNSAAVTPTPAGAFSFDAVYSGDVNNNGATSACEPLTVNKASPTITTTLSATTITVGSSVTDSSTLASFFQAGGTATYNEFSGATCAGTATVVSTVTVTNGVVPNSAAVTPTPAGFFSFDAVYSGDANNNGATSACEPLTVNKASPTITTTLSSTTPVVGTTVTDSSTLASFFQAGGTVTYSVFANGTCAAPGSVASIVTVTNGVIPSSRAVLFNATGSFAFQAVYSGDVNNNGATSACEPLTVQKASPTITTTLSATTITVGASVTDSSTLTSFFQAGGTVTYNRFGGATCAGTATLVSTVTVTNGVVPTSAANTPTPAGAFSFDAVYSGDANNNGATSACEPLTVNKASPTIATTLSATTITVGASVTDSSTLTNSFQAGGTATYNEFSGATCAGTATVVSTVTVTNGVVPNSAAVTPAPAGAFSFDAVYSGDANNNGATSACEPLTVNKTSPTIATTLSATTITVGTSVTDSSTLANSFQAGGTATYNEFSGATCAGTATVVSTVTVTNGVVPNSAAVTPTPAGSFSFDAVYSGDANNNGATSACEPLTVNKTSPTITTTLSATTITVGTSVTDSSTLTNSFQAGGTATYNEFGGATCAGTATVVSTVTVTNGVVPNSAAVTPTPAGAFSFDAVYSGDVNNNGATSACEPLTVNKTSPTIATTLSATTITVGTSVTDSSTLTGSFQAGGTATYNEFGGATCAGTATVVSTVTVTNGVVPNSAAVTPTPAGSFSFDAVYSGDANNSGATSACEPLTVNKTSPTITTTLSATTIIVGTSVTDSSTLTNSFQAGGTATYNEFSGATCAGTATVVSTVTVTNGVVPNSAAVTPTPAGFFSFDAVYSGDANNNGATSACEPLTVNKASPTIATTLSATTITVGSSVSDSATLTSFFQAGGTATYNEFSGATCTGTATIVSTVTVTNGVVPNSAAVTPTPAGAFSFDAVYSGDANNNGATSACEPLTVNKTSPTITTTLSATTITVGSSVTDSSTLASFFQAGGTATYNEFSGATCAGTATVVSTVTVTNGIVPNSAAVTPTPAGAFSFDAVYSGDVNNNGATSACEPLTVNKASPTITTTLSATTITVGTSVTDSSTLASFFQAGGTATYNEFSGATCAGTATVVSTVTVTNGVVPNSAAVTPSPAGSFSFDAVYSGDVNNNGATSACEPLTVNKASPTITTTLSATTITVGTSVTDSSTLASFFQAGGTATYNEFSGATCSGTATVVSTVTVTNGIVPNSAAVTPSPAGSFSFDAVYSGDVNNNGATSACEPLTVNKASPTITTTLSATTITVGASVTDSSTMASFFQAGGTATYNEFSGATCAGTAAVVSTVTVTNGVVPNSAAVTSTPAGSFSFDAVYSGDANNNGATSACEPLTVNKASPTITTTLSSTTITVGSSVTDSSTLASFFQAGGTATYNEFSGATCAGTATVVSTVTVTNGVVPNSAAVTPTPAGSFSFDAVYSGDANNNGATSACEPLTVNKASPTIATTLSATSIHAGQTVTDSSTMAGFFQAGGTVTYNLFSNGTCAVPGTGVSTVTVTNGVVPNSRAVLFNATGSFSFDAVYSGDVNNNGATSACEPLSVVTGVTISTTLSSTTPVVGTSVTDSATLQFQTATAGGTVTYSDFANGTCTAPGTVVSVVTVTNGVVPNSRAVLLNATGALSFQASYSGDAANNGATSACEPLTIQKASPTITTTLSATTITVGASVTDSSTMASFFQAGGTVTYNRFSSSSCAGTATVVSTVTVTNGVVPSSAANTPTPAGAYGFDAVYSGDANNNGATSVCEPLTVNKASPTITTTLSATTITVGTSVTDSSTLAGSFQAGGTATYNEFSGATCAGTATVVSTVTVTNGVVPNSAAVTPTPAGAFSFDAVYSGDVNNNGATSACEPLTVNKASPTISTTLSATTVTVGTAVTDSSTLASFFQAGGTVTYNEFSGATCAGTATVVSTVIVTNGVVPNSAAVTPTPAGAFSFDAIYSGDVNNNGATSACEPLTVNKASPTITTTLSATTITVGTSVTDSSTMASFFQAGGTATYNEFSGGTCAGTATVVSTVTVTNGVVPNSAAVTPTPAGAFSFDAVYSGDANNNGATSACEPLTVNKTSPTIATTLSATTITVGTSVTDSSTLTSSFQAGGTATYNEFSGATCAGTAAVVSTVTVTNGVVPNSAAVTPSPAGSFSFDAVYSGDANNNGATSACEPLTVNKASPTIATTLSATTVTVGASVTDSSTLTNSFQAGGTATYNEFSGGTCAGTATVVSTVTVTNGVVPNSAAVTPTPAGAFSFDAVYSGDANNNGATSACEPLTVNKASPTITTTLSATTITVGSSVTDSSTLANFFQAGGTATYNEFSGATCAGTATVVSTVTVTNGVVPNSAAVTPTPAGSFSFDAVYSGDANNNGATSACEPLTVNKASPTITTTLSATTITVGASVTDSSTLASFFQAGGTATYNEFSGATCAGTATVVSTVTVTNGIVPNSAAVTPSPAGSFSFDAVYSGDVNNNGATSACEPLTVNKTSPTIATTLSATTITVGSSVTDSATLTNFFQAGGTATYNEFSGSTCAGTATVVSTVTVTNGIVPNSASVTPVPTGLYSFDAVYSGDANNNGATSACEPLTVNKATPTITTTVSSTSVRVGSTASDSATLTGGFQAGGSVTYVLFANGTCTGTSSTVSTVTVTNGVVPNSRAVTFNATGSFAFQAQYLGDINNVAATSACEPLTVVPGVAISTTLSSTTPVVGTTVTDSSTLSGQTATAGGTVTYTVFANGTCAVPGTTVSVVTVTNGVVPNSRAVLFNSTGSFSFQASYGGDASNNAATSGCEPLTVQKASPTITTTLSATTINVGASVTDSSTLASFFQAGGSVTYNEFSGATCAGTATAVSTVTVTNGVVPNSAAVTPVPAGSYSFDAVYSGDTNNNGATSACEPLTVNKASPTISTSLSATSITVGTSVTDSATLASFFQAGGTATYNEFTGSTCAGTATVVSTVTVTNGVIPSSAAVTLTPAGSYSFDAVYNGDVNNNVATSACEPITVNKTNPTIATTLSATTITVGSSVTDSSTLTNSFQAGGTATYNEFSGATCAGTATVVSTVTVTNGVVPNSAAVTPTPAGSFSFDAVYSGDANNNGATSACEPLTVNKASPTIATTLSATTITAGQTVTDSATLASFFQAGGTVTYNLFSNGTCAVPGTIVSTVTVTNGVVPNSRAVLFNSTGSFSFQAVYSGDANNNGATSPCEPLSVGVVQVTIRTTLSATTIIVGATVTDSATLSGQTATAGGMVTYNEFANGTCTGTATIVSTVTVTNGVVPNSASVTPVPAGSFSFDAVYSGDANNNGATSPCEPLTVNKASPSISTALSATTVTAGQTVTDSAILANFFQAGGTVTYNEFSGGTCAGAATVLSTVTVTNGVVPNSAPFKAPPGPQNQQFSFQAVYSGDANNNGATSACEPLIVQTPPVTIVTMLSATTITVGQSVTDSATITGGVQPVGGTVTYNEFGTGTCSGTATVISTVTVTNGVVPSSSSVTPTPAGSFSFDAVYSGDVNNNGATSACEPLTVNKASPTITTTLSSSTITVGSSVSDSSTLASFFQAGGSVTYNEFGGATCAGTATVVSTVTVTNGVVPNSAAVTPAPAGSFSFDAVYSGDANNNGATSVCEPLTVNKASPILNTTPSAPSITVGSSISDSATLTGGFQAGGTVSYSLFSNGTCTGTVAPFSTVTVTTAGIPSSSPVTPTPAGSYAFQATYSGDINNNGTTSACEPFTVGMTSPTLNTAVSATTIVLTNSVFDTATLTGGFQAGGTVTYTLFSNGTCTGTGSMVGSPVTVTNGIVPNSATLSPTQAITYSFRATYSGDANNNPATSPCEPFNVTDFTIAISTTYVKVNAGDTATITVTVAPVNGFTGSVSLTPNAAPGLTATFGTNPILGGSGTSTVTLSAAVAANYTLTVTGMTGSLQHTTAQVLVQVVDFQIFASPVMVNTFPNIAGNSTITVMAVNGFTGTVTLNFGPGPCTITPSMITGSGNALLQCTFTTGGTFPVTVTGSTPSITGTAMVLSHPTTVTFNVQDYTLTACTPQPVIVNLGSNGSCAITVTPVGGFTGTVTLSFTHNGTIAASLTPTMITISGSATLTVMTNSSTATGLYVFTVTGSSPGLTNHMTTASFKVQPVSQCPTCAPPDLTQMNWVHRLSLSKTGGVQTWKFGVSNGPAGSNTVTIFVNVRITITDGSISTTTLNSGPLTLGPGKNLVNQSLSTTFTTADLSTTFNWSVSIQWGTSPTALVNNTFTDTNNVPTSGSFTVLP